MDITATRMYKLAFQNRRIGEAGALSVPIGAILSGFFFLSPYLLMFLTSLKPTSELFSSPVTILPHHWTWSNYINVWHFAPIAGYLRTTMIIAGTSTVIVIFVAVPAVYSTARMRFRGRKV